MTDQKNSTTLTHEALDQYAGSVINYKAGEMVSLMIHFGDRLGLYSAMKDLGICTAADLATKTGFQERWLLEWLRGQTAAGLLEYQGEDKFLLPEAGQTVLLDPTHPAYLAGFFGAPTPIDVIDKTADAFQTGIGLTWDAHGPKVACMIKRATAATHAMLPTIIGMMNGTEEKLQTGAKVVDIGCGSGVALRELAKKYPNSSFEGYDPSEVAIDMARRDTLAEGLSNITYFLAGGEDLPKTPTYDLAMTLDCMHDMTQPQIIIETIRRSIKADGAWLIKDITTSDDFTENLANPMSPLFYGFSVLYCMSASLSEPSGAGLGTMGFNPVLAQKMTSIGGFNHFRLIDFEEDLFNSFYEVRP
jgi:2-polyprenyl-3-methyl-5-hydroxy-6-metoxy-1,4-benzoquinol methylase